MNDKEYYSWLAGLIDGEGCFRIQENKSRKGSPNSSRSTYSTSFQLKLRNDDHLILKEIHKKLGIGKIKYDTTRNGNSKPCCIWIVENNDGCVQLMKLLDKYPLKTRKLQDFLVWREAVKWRQDTPKGNRWAGPRDWSQIAKMKEELNEARTYKGGGANVTQI